MESRYVTPEMKTVLSDHHKHETWHRILVQVARAQAQEGLIPNEFSVSVADRIAQKGVPTPQLIGRYEANYRHDVAGFIGAQTSKMYRGAKPYVYYGLTSSDLVDTGNAIIHDQAINLIRRHMRSAIAILGERATRMRTWEMVGRTHGQAAAPVDASRWLRTASDELLVQEQRADDLVFFGKLSGPVGMLSKQSRAWRYMEERALEQLGVARCETPTQITPRLEYAELAFRLVQIVSVCESVAMRIRLLSQTGIEEVREYKSASQRGSSSMPHKTNPIRSERICGLARVARGLLQPLLETHGAVWSERDISNSSVERTALRDLLALTDFVLIETAQVVGSLSIDRGRMQENLAQCPDSAAELRRAIKRGEDRDAAYDRLK